MRIKEQLVAKGKIKRISQFSLYALSFYFSALLFLGILIGHLFSWYVSEKALARKFFRLVVLPVFKKQNLYIHIHHWIMGFFGLLVYRQIALKYGLDSGFIGHFLIIGFFGGVITQGIFMHSDWHKIFKRKTFDL